MIVQPWAGLFLIFSQYIYIKVGKPQVLGKPWVWKTLCEITLMMGSNNLINQNMSRSGWPFTCSGRNKPIKCLVTIGCIQSFLCVQNWVYNARHKIVVFASCAAFGMQQLCLSEPDPSLRRVSSLDIYSIFMTIRDKTSKPQDLPMTWDDQPFYFWRQLNAHFTFNLGSPAFKLIEK